MCDLTSEVCDGDVRQYSNLVLYVQALKQIHCMAGGKKHGGQKVSTKEGRKRERRPKVSGAPSFEVTGTHVVILVGALFALAWFAGLLPDP